MPKYVNTRTGAVVEPAPPCSGEDWEEQKEGKPKKPAAKKQQKNEKRCISAAKKDVKTDE